MLVRSINILKSNSFLLFGARGTGKTKLIEALLPANARLIIDLLDPGEYETFSLNPNELQSRLKNLPNSCQWVVIDEVQRVPNLLNIVHQSIEKTKLKFALTGSSARKLKRGGANLLAGRAYTYHLFPFTFQELGNAFNLQDALEWGTLPKISSITSAEEKKIFLQSYAHTYIREEIQAEQIVRKLEPFRRFLSVVAQSNGSIISYANIAKDVGTTDVTVRTYFQILEDTLLGFLLEPYHGSIRKRQRESPKFYLFDTGVQRALSKTLDVPLKSQTYAYGRAFEHLVICEIVRLCSYARNDFTLSYLRTKDDAEIDLIIERPGKSTVLVEIKSTEKIDETDVSSLGKFLPDFRKAEAICLSLDPHPKILKGISCMPWQEGIKHILGA